MQRITQSLTNAGFEACPSDTILQDMWDKWVFLASLAGITCLMRAPVGDIVATPGGTAVTLGLLEECRAVAERSAHAPAEATLQRARSVLTETGSSLTASMLRDLQHGHAIEADHVIGDMLARAGQLHDGCSLLAVVYAHLKTYEAGRTRAA
jgi:2-dehydropantoate 2-reductase